MIKNPLFHLSNFEMAVSYGATFPVLVLLLSIGFTGYLEVNKHFVLSLAPTAVKLKRCYVCFSS